MSKTRMKMGGKKGKSEVEKSNIWPLFCTNDKLEN